MRIENIPELIKEVCKKGYIKVSVPFLLKHINCTPEGRKKCEGRCCKGHSNVKSETKIYTKFTDEEYKRLPKNIQKYVINNIVQNENGVCKLLDFCKKYPELKPVECKLFPLDINKNGILIVNHWVPLHCPNYKKGNLPAYKALKDNLIDVFGEKVYKEIVRQCEGDIKKWM